MVSPALSIVRVQVQTFTENPATKGIAGAAGSSHLLEMKSFQIYAQMLTSDTQNCIKFFRDKAIKIFLIWQSNTGVWNFQNFRSYVRFFLIWPNCPSQLHSTHDSNSLIHYSTFLAFKYHQIQSCVNTKIPNEAKKNHHNSRTQKLKFWLLWNRTLICFSLSQI